MASQIKLRRDTAANWELNNPTLASGEPGLETDTRKIKYGDGTSDWNTLQYAAGGSTGSGSAFNGGTITGAMYIQNGTESSSTTTGALIVSGGLGVGGTMHTAEHYITYDTSNNPSYPGGFDAGLYIQNTYSPKTGVTLVGNDGDRIYLAQSSGTFYLSQWGGIVDPTTTGKILTASSSSVQVNTDLHVNGTIYSGVWPVNTASGGGYTLPPATTATLGGVKLYPGGSIGVQPDGTIGVAINFVSGTGTTTAIVWPDDGSTPPAYYVNLNPASGSSLGGVKIGAGVNVDSNGVISVTTGAFALQTATSVVLGGIKLGTGFTATGDGTVSVDVAAKTSGPLTTSTGALIGVNSATNMQLTAFPSYALFKIGTTTATWLTIYNSAASRTSDASRTIGTDPQPSAGVIAEVITTGSTTVPMTPAVIGWNDFSTSTVYMKAVNISGTDTTISVTLTMLQLEG